MQVVRPWKAGWQLWEIVNRPGSSWNCTRRAARPEELVCSGCAVFLPAKTVPVIPIWVSTADPDVVRESALLQLEMAGLGSAITPSNNFEIDVLEVFSERTLLRACVYPSDFSVPARTDYYGFRPSPLGLHLPEDAITLWQEAGHCVAAVSRGGAVVVWEATPMPEKKEDVVIFFGWLESFCAEMLEGDFLGKPQFILDYADVMVREGKRVEEFGGLDVVAGAEEDGPPPLWPADGGRWVPPAVLEAREAQKQRQRLVQIVLVGSSVIAVLLAVTSGIVAWSNSQLKRLRSEVALAERAAEPWMRVARDWEILVPTILPERFALEKLLLAVKALPADGVRFIVFESTEEGLRIEGEAKNVGLATVYYNSIQMVEGASFYDWTMASPILQPDNTARFAIEGKLKK
ncbi:MAG: hypothetical protein NZL93_02465 [Chthoniobacterales bacterium]|nr:hypothetical protein [Chthoniobacterales bacterium]